MSDKKEVKKEVKMTEVYKSNGNSLNVNPDMLPYLKDLGLSETKPK